MNLKSFVLLGLVCTFINGRPIPVSEGSTSSTSLGPDQKGGHEAALVSIDWGGNSMNNLSNRRREAVRTR